MIQYRSTTQSLPGFSISNFRYLSYLLATLFIMSFTIPALAQWKPAPNPLFSRWASQVSPQNDLPDYPRPQLKRTNWENLNGLWNYAIRPRLDSTPAQFDGKILVPFPVESALSGVRKQVGPDSVLWYQRSFNVDPSWRKGRVLLHFGAVDWRATIWVNGIRVGSHEGGYDPFTVDITSALKPGPDQSISVSVWDPSDSGSQPKGKQVRHPHSIWYTSTTGIWQTVWIEPVPLTYIHKIKITPDINHNLATVSVTSTSGTADIDVLNDSKVVSENNGPVNKTIKLEIPHPKLWSPASPFLYQLRIVLHDSNAENDTVRSYFGMRKISVGKDSHGITRLLLNNKPLFEYGPLDQGFWPGGIYTAPTDDALKSDIEVEKRLGFNMIRKHVKVEPERWYYWCDKLGMLVWQDMPSQFALGNKKNPPPAQAGEEFETELKHMIQTHYNHPSIVMWVIFNEGWGQYDTKRIVHWAEKYDPSRLINQASGWTHKGVGNVIDMHKYPGPGSPEPKDGRAAVLGEFGGLGLPLEGHTWQKKKNWGYRTFTDRTKLTDAYVDLIKKLRLLQSVPGVSAAVYTQTSDVEIEVNGLMTYDRAIIKMDTNRVKAVNKTLFEPVPRATILVPASILQSHTWKYTTDRPAADWYKTEFNDNNWKSGSAGFGHEAQPPAVIRTAWNGSDIWLRRTVTLTRKPRQPVYLRIYHDEDAQVYINGKQVVNLSGYSDGYNLVRLSRKSVRYLKRGKNHIAVHCHQTKGGQFIDLGLVEIADK